ncbi:MAG: peptidylprolyl isomerase [candidate division WOR-3 bacterium]
MKNKIFNLFFFIFSLSALNLKADRIFIQVNDSIILESEYKEKLFLIENSSIFNKEAVDSLKRNLVQILIDSKILQIIADKDSISVDSLMLLKEVDRRIEDLKKNFNDTTEFYDYLSKNGIKIDDLRKNYFQQATGLYLKRQILNKRMIKTSVNENEIKDFYEQNKDSFYVQPAADLYHISIIIQPDSLRMFDLLQKFESIVLDLKNGKDFTQLSKIYSEDKYAKKGGVVGYKKYGDLPVELANFLYQNRKADTLIFTQSREGMHIIKIIDAKDDSINYKQILLKFPVTKDDSVLAYNKISNIRKEIVNKKITFEDAAKKYSNDQWTKDKGGFVGRVMFEMVSENVRNVLKSLQENEVSEIVKGDFGYELFMIKNISGGKISSYEEVRDIIASVLESRKVEEEIQKLIDREKEKSFIKVYSE